jgi:hypothetical protein
MCPCQHIGNKNLQIRSMDPIKTGYELNYFSTYKMYDISKNPGCIER